MRNANSIYTFVVKSMVNTNNKMAIVDKIKMIFT